MMTFNAAAYAMIAALAVFPTAEAGGTRLLHPDSESSNSKSRSEKICKKQPGRPVTAFTDRATLKAAVNAFVGDRALWRGSMACDDDSKRTCGEIYGENMNDWDVSQVTEFIGLFYEYGKELFNTFDEDISCWDVSSGTDFYGVFSRASSFNQDIGGWDVSSGTNFYAMFVGASSFNQDLSDWRVSTSDRDTMFSGTAMPCDDPSVYPSVCIDFCRNDCP